MNGETAMKKFLSFIIALITAFGYVTAAGAVEETNGGYCGADNLFDIKWTEYDNGVLVINGSGKMKDYTQPYSEEHSPWNNYYNLITVEEGITSIGNYAFYKNRFETPKISLPRSLEKIGENVFWSPETTDSFKFKTVICYSGTQEEWQKIDIAESTKRALQSENCILTFNGETPAPYCKIVLKNGNQVGQYEYFEGCADYCLGDCYDAELKWSFGYEANEFSIFWLGWDDDKGDWTGYGHHGSQAWRKNYGKAGERTIHLSLVNPDGTIIFKDTVTVQVNPMPLKDKTDYFIKHISFYMMLPLAFVLRSLFIV